VVARYGGEEFAVILTYTGSVGAVRAAESAGRPWSFIPGNGAK